MLLRGVRVVLVTVPTVEQIVIMLVTPLIVNHHVKMLVRIFLVSLCGVRGAYWVNPTVNAPTNCPRFESIGCDKCCASLQNTGGSCNYYTYCTTQAEADSVACVLNPTLPHCAVVSDTLIFACSESMVNGQAVATIYRLSCKATNGEVTECNGKQNVDIPTDGQPVKQMSAPVLKTG